MQNFLFSDNASYILLENQQEQNLCRSLKLIQTPERIEIKKQDEPKLGSVYVNFSSSKMIQRCRSGAQHSEAIMRAVGVRGAYYPNIVDATAGLGRDAFLLASLGCSVTMLERHPVVATLLSDGLRRAYNDIRLSNWIKDRLTLIHISSREALSNITTTPDVVYLDPMYPHCNKQARPKKEMYILRCLVGKDSDANELLMPARMLAKKRIVVKRPSYASPLDDIKPHASIFSKKYRFDIYQPINDIGSRE
jgi:16S rRNA (guanine1516-N2)-methyltransferase